MYLPVDDRAWRRRPRLALFLVPLVILAYPLYLLAEGWFPRRADGRVYAGSWRYHCNPDTPTLFSYRSNFGLWQYRAVQPLQPGDPAWPYTSDQLPTLADAAPSATILVGIMTMDKSALRRRRIRETYARRRPPGTRVVFVQGQPMAEYKDAVFAEAREHGDMLILPIAENMNRGKTQSFLEWAAVHARVGESPPEFVMKADDDSFLNLAELERRLRVLPRTKSYWGCRHLAAYDYMSGQGYALSLDLVQYLADSPLSRWWRWGDEDQLIGDSLRFHPELEKIVFARDSCWTYDHPRKQKQLSHGFLFPDVVAKWSSPPRPPFDIKLRDVPSTVTPERGDYVPPPDVTPEQALEALIEESPLSFLNQHNLYDPADERLVHEAWRLRPTREERYTDRGRGATVLIHQVKSDEWWMETEAIMGDA